VLRNISRKSPETTQNVYPLKDTKERSESEASSEIDVEALIQENLQYKRVQKNLITQLQFVEKKVNEFKTEASVLHEQSQRSEAKVDFLKRVILSLSNSYGSESVRRATEQAMIDSGLERKEEKSNNIIQDYQDNSDLHHPYSMNQKDNFSNIKDNLVIESSGTEVNYYENSTETPYDFFSLNFTGKPELARKSVHQDDLFYDNDFSRFDRELFPATAFNFNF